MAKMEKHGMYQRLVDAAATVVATHKNDPNFDLSVLIKDLELSLREIPRR